MNDGDEPSYVASEGDALGDRELMLEIWQGNLGTDGHMAHKYDWFYRDCPYGPPLVQRLRHTPDGEWVGVCAMGRRRMLWQGREIRTGILVDLAVRPQHRSLGPALVLQLGLVDAARRQLDLALGFPNPKAAAVFKRIRYNHLTEIVRYARVLRHGPYVRRRLPGWLATPVGLVLDLRSIAGIAVAGLRGPRLQVQWSDRAVDAMDSLWRASPHGQGLLAVRDAEYVRWRFDASPLFQSRHLLLRDPADGSLLAWFTTRLDEGVLQVMDFWSLDGIDGVAPRYLDALLAAAWRLGCSAVSMQAATSPGRMASWIAKGFVERARRPVFAHWSVPRPAGEGEIDLHLTVADEDE